jgi:hypothetical protein
MEEQRPGAAHMGCDPTCELFASARDIPGQNRRASQYVALIHR